MSSSEPKKKLKSFKSIAVTPKIYEELSRLRDELGFATMSDLITHILRVYKLITTQQHSLLVSGSVPVSSTDHVHQHSLSISSSEHNKAIEDTSSASMSDPEPSQKLLDSVYEYVKKRILEDKDFVGKIDRKVQDMVNKFTSKIDELARNYGDLRSYVDELAERIGKLERALQEGLAESGKREKKPRRTAMDILREQKIVFESEIAKKIKNRDSYFARLEKEGAIVLECDKQRVAVEPVFWDGFLKKIQSLSTNNEDEIKAKLDPLEYKLFKELRGSALLVFDNSKKQWILLEQKKEKRESGESVLSENEIDKILEEHEQEMSESE